MGASEIYQRCFEAIYGFRIPHVAVRMVNGLPNQSNGHYSSRANLIELVGSEDQTDMNVFETFVHEYMHAYMQYRNMTKKYTSPEMEVICQAMAVHTLESILMLDPSSIEKLMVIYVGYAGSNFTTIHFEGSVRSALRRSKSILRNYLSLMGKSETFRELLWSIIRRMPTEPKNAHGDPWLPQCIELILQRGDVGGGGGGFDERILHHWLMADSVVSSGSQGAMFKTSRCHFSRRSSEMTLREVRKALPYLQGDLMCPHRREIEMWWDVIREERGGGGDKAATEDGCGVISAGLEPPRELTHDSPVLLEQHGKAPPPSWLSHLHRDLEVLETRAIEGEGDGGGGPETPKTPKTPKTLLDVLDRTTLRGSRAYLASILGGTPVTDRGELRARQGVLRALEAAGVGSTEEDDAVAAALAAREPDVLWFYRQRDDEALKLLCETAYFGTWPLRLANRRSPLALAGLHTYTTTLAPWIGVLSPIVYFVIPYLVLRWKAGLRMGFLRYLWTLLASATSQALCLGQTAVSAATRASSAIRGLSSLLSLAVYFHSALSSFDIARAFRRVGGTIAGRVEGAAEFLRMARARREAMTAAASAEAWFPLLGGGDASSSLLQPEHEKKCPTLLHRLLDVKRGTLLRDAARFDHSAAGAELVAAYALDALASILRARRELGLTWAEYVGDSGAPPLLDMRGLRHPCLASSSAVENDWALGQAVGAPNALLTGPNAGGKSTIMKAALACVLMAQTLTVTPCSRGCRLTPFGMVASHIGSVDRAGSESMFEAEMSRALRVLREAEAGSESGPFAFVVLDEIFSSTNPVEGIGAATAVGRRLGSCPWSLSIISTHYVHLGRLLCRRAGTSRLRRFASFQMPVELPSSVEMAIRYPHRLRRGLCRQVVALELMRRAGFDAELVGDALSVVEALSAKKQAGGGDQVPTVVEDDAQDVVAINAGKREIASAPPHQPGAERT